MKTLIAVYKGFVAYTFLTFLGVLGSGLLLISSGRLRRFNAEVLSPFFCRITLFLIGIKSGIKNPEMLPNEPVVFMFNHNSSLDIFLIPLLRLENARFIISTKTKKILPLFLCNIANGSLFIPMKEQAEARQEFFKETTKNLAENSHSVVCSPEGVQPSIHGISPFNKGVFEMAARAKRPICPLFFYIPQECNPFDSYFFERGTVEIEIMPLVRTDNWSFSTIAEEANKVRLTFVTKFNERHAAQIQ